MATNALNLGSLNLPATSKLVTRCRYLISMANNVLVDSRLWRNHIRIDTSKSLTHLNVVSNIKLLNLNFCYIRVTTTYTLHYTLDLLF